VGWGGEGEDSWANFAHDIVRGYRYRLQHRIFTPGDTFNDASFSSGSRNARPSPRRSKSLVETPDDSRRSWRTDWTHLLKSFGRASRGIPFTSSESRRDNHGVAHLIGTNRVLTSSVSLLRTAHCTNEIRKTNQP